jgi:AcrR family transcriptional regulator
MECLVTVGRPSDTGPVASTTDGAGSTARRTQAERRATTRSALLDAAVDSLVESGYAGTTTRGVAARAGVSVGALQHHFSSKAELLAHTVDHIRARWAGELLTQGIPRTRSLRRRHEVLLDRMWRIYRGPLFRAFLELNVAARHDPELRAEIAGSEREMAGWNERFAPLLYPEHADRPELLELITTGQAAMRGLALTGLASDTDPDALWPTTRAHLLDMNAEVLGDPELAR